MVVSALFIVSGTMQRLHRLFLILSDLSSNLQMNPEWNVQMQSQIEDLTTTWQKPGPVRASVSRPEDFIGLFGPERYKKGSHSTMLDFRAYKV